MIPGTGSSSPTDRNTLPTHVVGFSAGDPSHVASPYPPPAHRLSLLFGLWVLAMLIPALEASPGWPNLLGPTRNAVYAGSPLATHWPADGPPIVWRKDVGEGYSSPVVAEGRLVQCHRIEDQLQVDCVSADTGVSLWTFRHEMKFRDGASFDHGPRPTPAIHGGKVFIHNTDGYLVCLDLRQGTKLWSRRPKSEFQSSATWHGCVSSPVVTDQAVFLTVGGTNDAGVVAFAPEDGRILWQALREKASASTPVLARLDGKDQLVVVTREALHGMDPQSGREFWQVPTRKQSSGNVYAASPVVFDDQVFLSGWYQLGAQLVRIQKDRPETRWHLDDALSTHYASIVVKNGYAYGFHGHAWERGGPTLRCVDLATGKVSWEGPRAGSGTLILAGDQLVILSDIGELQLADASPAALRIRQRAQVVGRVTRSYPAIADGLAYIKGPRQLVCVDLRPR